MKNMRLFVPLFMLILVVVPAFAQDPSLVLTSRDGIVIEVYDLTAPGVSDLVRAMLSQEQEFFVGEHPEIADLEQRGAIKVSTAQAVKSLLGENNTGNFLSFVLFALLAAVPLVVVYHEVQIRQHRKRR